MPTPSIYLASKSPRRQQLLHQLGVSFAPLWPDDVESEQAEALERVLPGESPAHYVERVARLKLQTALTRLATRSLPRLPVLAADTTVALGSRILGKPTDPDHAISMLKALSGQSHKVFTAIALARPKAQDPQQWQVESVLSRSKVLFARLSDAQIEAYVATGEPMDKAGAYAYQGGAARFVRKIEGSATGIIGLPLYECAKLLRL
jgi:septum formation protein